MATSPEKRSLEELVTTYTLEPSLRDIYVEGISDESFLKWYFDGKGIQDVTFVAIDNVEISAADLKCFNLNLGESNQQYVICAAEYLSKKISGNLKVKFIADKDFDQYLNNLRTNNFLLYTDYNSLEMYYFNNAFINKFFRNVLRSKFNFTAAEFLAEIGPILKTVFLIRLVNQKLNLGMKLLNFTDTKYLNIKTRPFTFNEQAYIANSLNNNRHGSKRIKFEAELDSLRKQLDPDPRNCIRGHDFTNLFFEIVKKYGGARAGFKDLLTFEGTLCGCLELNHVEQETLFKNLRKV